MKIQIFISSTLLAALPLLAQTAGTTVQPSQPAQPFTPLRSGLPASPVNPGLPAGATQPGLPASPTAPGLPGFTNAFGLGSPSFTNTFGTNQSFQALSALLANLQNDMQLALPAVAAFNDNFEFSGGALTAANNLGTSGTTTAVVNPNRSGQNFGANVANNASTRAGVNASANLSVSPGPATTGTAGTTAGTGATAGTGSRGVGNLMAGTPGGTTRPGFIPTPTGVNNARGLAPGFGGPGANVVSPAMRDTFRALIVLQNDMERMLPILAALNNGTLETELGGVNFTGGLTNGFSTGTNAAPFTGSFGATNGQGTVQRLFPTGRSTFGRPAPGTGTGAAGAGTSSGTGASGSGAAGTGSTRLGTGASGSGAAGTGPGTGGAGTGASGSGGTSR